MIRHRVALAALLTAVAVGACDSRTPSPAPGSGAPAPSGEGAVTGPPGPPVGTPGPSGATIARPPACEVLFPAEVADVLGVEIEDAQEQPMSSEDDGGWTVDCVYWRQTFHDQAPMELTLGSGARSLGIFDDIRGRDGVSPVSGLGDEAVVRLATIAGLDGPVASLFVRSSGAVLGLSLGIVGVTDDGVPELAGDGPTQTAMLTSLAQVALRRLTGPPEASAKTCELLPAAEAAALVGATFAEAVDVDDHDVWGPSCRYEPGTGPNQAEQWVDLYVAVSSAAAARPHFDGCKAGGAVVPGLGDEAFTAPFECAVKFGFFFNAAPLMVRSGEIVVAVARRDGGQIGGAGSQDKLIAVARSVLDALGAAPGATLPPVNADLLVHPCSILSAAEVGGIVGATIVDLFEDPVDEAGTRAQCSYGTSEYAVIPLKTTLGKGTIAVNQFTADVKRDSNFTALPGLGDEAFTRQGVNETDQPLVAVVVRSGDLVLNLQFGAVRQSADYLSYVAPGTPEQQIEMARKLVALMLSRMLGS